MTATAPVSLNGHEPSRLRAALEAAGGSLKSLTVLAPQNDPFRVDTPAGHRDGAWLANTLDRLGITGQRHLRGLHYILIGQRKPNGQPYTNTDSDWVWLASVAKAARWNRYLPFDRIVDQRNDAPEIIPFVASRLEPWPYVNVDFDIAEDVVSLPDADDLTPRVGLASFAAAQPYRIVLVGEKSSLRPVLGGIAQRYSADLFLPAGEMSDTMAYQMADAAARDGRPLVVFYFADCDPAGWQMPISLCRKLQALTALEFDELEFEVHRVALIPDHVRMYDLPSTPLKDTERRADRWVQATGVRQTEIDSIAAMQPELLERIAIDAIAPFYDATLNRRIRDAEREWLAMAQESVDEQAADHLEQIHTDVVPLLEEKQAEIQAIVDRVREELDDVRVDADMFDLPPVPSVPQPQLDGDQPEPLCDSRWDFTEQCESLISSKNYYDARDIGGW